MKLIRDTALIPGGRTRATLAGSRAALGFET